MLGLLKKEPRNEIYNLTHSDPPNARRVMAKGFEILGISSIKYTEKALSKEEKEKLHEGNRRSLYIQKKVDSMLDRYIPYVTFERQFSLDTTKQALGEEFRQPPPITGNFLFLLLNYAVGKNFAQERRAADTLCGSNLKR